MKAVAVDDVERIGIVMDVSLVLFQETCLVVGIEGQVLSHIEAFIDGGQEYAHGQLRILFHALEHAFYVGFSFCCRQVVFNIGQIDISRFDVAQERRRRYHEGDFGGIEDFFPGYAQALNGKCPFRRYVLADTVENFVRQEEFKTDGQVEKEARRRIEGCTVSQFIEA